MGNNTLPEDLVEEIVGRTDGVPLFIEELTKAVIETGASTGRKTVAAVPLPEIAVPATLHASLMARLDRLGPAAKEIAQVGAAIGRDFAYELLAPVAQREDEQLKAELGRLSDAGLIFCRGTPPAATFLFKHALIRDAAYGSLLRDQRRRLHASIAGAYKSHFPDVARAQPEIVAYHLTEAGRSEAAIDYWQRAGELAIARSGNAEAIHHFSEALRLLATLGDKPGRAAKELELCLELGPALMIAKGTASPEVHAIYTRAAALQPGEFSPERFKALWGLYYHSMSSGQLSQAALYAHELLSLARRLGADDLLLEAYHANWATSLWRGELPATDQECRHGVSLYERDRHHALAHAFSGHDPGACARGIRAIALILSGFAQQATELGAEAVALARSLAHPYSLAFAMWHDTIVLQVRREQRRCRDVASELVELSREHRFPMMEGSGLFFLGWASADAGEIDGGVASMERGLDLVTSTGRRVGRPYMLAVLASAKAGTGKLAEASQMVDDALSDAEGRGEHWWKADLYRMKGSLLLARGDEDESEAWLRRSLETSRAQNALALELRAAASLARFWRDHLDKRSEARDLLAAVYGRFTEGFDTPDLQEAKVLLDMLE